MVNFVWFFKSWIAFTLLQVIGLSYQLLFDKKNFAKKLLNTTSNEIVESLILQIISLKCLFIIVIKIMTIWDFENVVCHLVNLIFSLFNVIFFLLEGIYYKNFKNDLLIQSQIIFNIISVILTSTYLLVVRKDNNKNCNEEKQRTRKVIGKHYMEKDFLNMNNEAKKNL
uniref:Transmembrane protein n=1 Tax=Strongyloides venezuelensis TaxID=75913 RepID=A0A0K0ETZ5_STRVS